MGQSITLYRISKDTFERLKNGENFKTSSAKSYSIFNGSFMGLEFLLSKGQDKDTRQLITEIFAPSLSISEENKEQIFIDEPLEGFEEDIISYLENLKITQINNILEKVSEAEFRSRYNPKELNNNYIYPSVWHNDNSQDQAFNERHLAEDFSSLKKIFKHATEEQDYILVFAEY